MKEITIKVSDKYYILLLQFLKSLNYVEVKQQEKQLPENQKYDFSDLAGKLEWNGNAVAEQRLLRDEW